MILEMFMIAAIILMISAVASMLRVILGPTAPDRVVGMDVMNTTVVAVFLAMGVIFDEVIYIDVAIVYTFLAFVATLYIANYLQGDSK